MASVKKGLGAAVSCLLALSLVIVASCAPLCAGTACLPQKAAGSQAGCHGMTDHDEASTALTARAGACQPGDAAVALIDKSGLGLHPGLYVVGILAADDTVQRLAARHSEIPLFDSSPGSPSSRAAVLVLRV